MSKNVDFFETRFSQVKRIGIRLYTHFMISKNDFNWFLWLLTCFALKTWNPWKSGKVRRTSWFLWIRYRWSMKYTCMLYCTHMWLKNIHGIDIWSCLVNFDSLSQIFLKLWSGRRTLWKLIFKFNCLANLVSSFIWLSKDMWIIVKCRKLHVS